MSGIGADTETIRKAARDTIAAREVSEGELKKLKDEVAALAPVWQGQAGQGFQRLMEKWDANSRDLLVAMDNIADQLTAAGGDIEITDEEELAAINKFEQALG